MSFLEIFTLCVFVITYVLMIILAEKRHWVAITSAVVLTVALAVSGQMTVGEFFGQIEWNVLLILFGIMGTVEFFIDSKMPDRMADLLLQKSSNVMWAAVLLSAFSGIVSAFLDNVATVLMIAPVALAISKKLKISPVAMLISIAVSSNLQGAATLVGDTTSVMLAESAHMNFVQFIWMDGRPGIFWAVELGALATVPIIMFIFRKDKAPVTVDHITEVTDYVPSFLLLGTILALIAASFFELPVPFLNDNKNGLICVLFFFICIIYALCKKDTRMIKEAVKDIDFETLSLLTALFIVIGALKKVGLIDRIADLFVAVGGSSPFLMYCLIVWGSVLFSAFIDNIPYVLTMLPVVAGIAAKMGVDPRFLMYGLLIGATLGGNITPVGASANIAAIGILRRNDYKVTNKDFFRIGIPFTLTAVIVGFLFVWFVWGPASLN